MTREEERKLRTFPLGSVLKFGASVYILCRSGQRDDYGRDGYNIINLATGNRKTEVVFSDSPSRIELTKDSCDPLYGGYPTVLRLGPTPSGIYDEYVDLDGPADRLKNVTKGCVKAIKSSTKND